MASQSSISFEKIPSQFRDEKQNKIVNFLLVMENYCARLQTKIIRLLSCSATKKLVQLTIHQKAKMHLMLSRLYLNTRNSEKKSQNKCFVYVQLLNKL